MKNARRDRNAIFEAIRPNIRPIVEEIVNKTIVIISRVTRTYRYMSFTKKKLFIPNGNEFGWIIFDFNLLCNEISLLFFSLHDRNCDRVKFVLDSTCDLI